MIDPAAFLGKPLPEMMRVLDKLDAAALPALVELHGPAALAEAVTCRPADMMVTTIGDTDLPADHPQVEVPGVVLVHLLGGGGQGWVYAAKTQATGKIVAVKVLRSDTGVAQSWALREASICCRLHHPNILRIFQAERAGPYWVVIMEMIQGKDLDKNGLTSPELRACVREVADALDYLQRRGVVHCDVKPSNILLRRKNHRPVLVDFGIAQDLARPEEITAIYGTPYYMPPEAFGAGRPDSSWDAYALGVTVASVLGVRQQYSALSTLRTAKCEGSFDQDLAQALGAIVDIALRNWILDLIDRRPERRRLALEQTQARLAA